MYDEILYEVTDPVASITLNRPDRLNALTLRTLEELRHAAGEAERDPRVVGLLVTGAGRGFCAGMDMQALDAIAREGGRIRPEPERRPLPANPGDPALARELGGGLSFLLALRKPVVAALNGPCAGFGLSIALFCDLRFASRGARLTTSFSQRGLIAEHGQSWILPRLLGPSRALDLLWSARKVDAEEALRLGLVDRVCEPEQLLPEARAYLEDLAAHASPTSLMVMKQQVYRHLMQPLASALAETNRLMQESLERGDFREGIRSYQERRPPRFERLRLE